MFYLQQDAQKRRGGLSVCLKDAKAAKEFRDLLCINSMISTKRKKITKAKHKRPILAVKNKPLKRPKGRKRPKLAKKNRG